MELCDIKQDIMLAQRKNISSVIVLGDKNSENLS